jgi:hypothetical protein
MWIGGIVPRQIVPKKRPFRPEHALDLRRDRLPERRIENRGEDRGRDDEMKGTVRPRQTRGVTRPQVGRRKQVAGNLPPARIELYSTDVSLTHTPANQIAEPADGSVTNLQARVSRLREHTGFMQHAGGYASARPEMQRRSRLPSRVAAAIDLTRPPSVLRQNPFALSACSIDAVVRCGHSRGLNAHARRVERKLLPNGDSF